MNEGLDRLVVYIPFSMKRDFKTLCAMKGITIRDKTMESLETFIKDNAHLLPSKDTKVSTLNTDGKRR